MAQLYRLLSDIELPSGASPLIRTDQHLVTHSKLSSLPLMYWPNAIPCHLANLWLMEIAKSSTGKESAKTSATLITHLVRFCFTRNISFYDFNDSYLRILTSTLQNDFKTGKHKITQLTRSNSQVLAIQHTTLRFLLWIQQNHPPYEQPPIIGLAIDQPRTVIEWRHRPQSRKPYLWHPALVTPTPPINDKFPMPEKYIAKLRNAVYQRYQEMISRHQTSKKKPNQYTMETLKYLYSRRMFTINMMTNFGLRPQELQELSISENSDITSTLAVTLPTKKTRVASSSRRLKVNMGLAITLQSYFDDRSNFIDFLTEYKTTPMHNDHVLLGKSGEPLNKASLTKEFDRICSDAGFENQKVCLSMFRHRFISREVKAELLLRFKKNPDFLMELTPSLKENVARTVILKTGHRSPSSIWHYVDEQYKLLATPDSHESFRSIKDDLDQTKNTLEDLQFRQHFNSREDITDELTRLRDHIHGLEERLYAAERKREDI